MKNRVTFIISIVCLLLFLTACNNTNIKQDNTSSGSNSAAYQKITAADGKKLLDSGAELTLVDVRRADEYEKAHIPGAINIPNESIKDTKPDAIPSLNRTIVVYCRTGVRSKQAADKLIKMGYIDVRDMGGIEDWPYDTVSSAKDEVQTSTGNKSDTSSTGLMTNFSTKDIDGNKIDRSIFSKYNLTMVNVWATYCGPCLSEMPELGELANEYESKGVRIVGIVADVLDSDGSVSNTQLDTVRSIIAQTGADYMHIIPSDDLQGVMSQITAVPTTFFVDADGKQVGSMYIGSKSKAEWNDIIVKMLKEIQK